MAFTTGKREYQQTSNDDCKTTKELKVNKISDETHEEKSSTLKDEVKEALKWAQEKENIPEFPTDSLVFDEMKTKADEGDVYAQLAIGNHYEDEGLEHIAMKYYEMASLQGHPLGFLGLAYVVFTVIDDEQLSFDTFMKAANMGVSEAQYRVGLYYLKGWLEENRYPPIQDEEMALIWLKKAAVNQNEYALEILKILE